MVIQARNQKASPGIYDYFVVIWLYLADRYNLVALQSYVREVSSAMGIH